MTEDERPPLDVEPLPYQHPEGLPEHMRVAVDGAGQPQRWMKGPNGGFLKLGGTPAHPVAGPGRLPNELKIKRDRILRMTLNQMEHHLLNSAPNEERPIPTIPFKELVDAAAKFDPALRVSKTVSENKHLVVVVSDESKGKGGA